MTCKRFFSLVLAMITVFSIAVLPLQAADGAEIVTETIDKTTAYEDLSAAKKDGKAIDMATEFPLNKSADEKDFRFITFVETGYKKGTSNQNQDDFALYCYVYYPRGTKLIPSSTKHMITLATSFDKTDASGATQTDPMDWRASNYKKFSMTLIEDNDTATGYGVYPVLKFKVNVTPGDLNNVTGDSRRYDVSEVELHFRSTTTAESFTVGHSFICSGYRKGYGSDAAKDTFSMTTSDIDVVEIDIEQTHFRYANQEDVHLKTQVNTVYFAVDEDFYNQWEEIVSIKARWFEAQSSPMVVTSDQALYEELTGTAEDSKMSYIGVDLNTLSANDLPERTLTTYKPVTGFGDVYYEDYWQYNSLGRNAIGYLFPSDAMLTGNYNKLMWLFRLEDENEDPMWQQSLQDASVSTKRLQDYYKNRLIALGWEKGKYDNEKLYTTGLVERTVDDGRIYGWQEHELGGTITVEGFDYGSGISGWWNRLVLGSRDEKTLENIKVIEQVSFEDVSGVVSLTNEKLCEKYLVAEEDAVTFKEFCATAYAEYKIPVVFHFATTDYYAAPLRIHTDGLFGGNAYYNLAFVAKETLFLDFDILQFTCRKDGENVVVPVASSPTNVMGPLDAPSDQGNPSDGLPLDFGTGLNSILSDLKSALAVFLGILVIAIIVILALNLIGPVTTVTGAIGSGISSTAKSVSDSTKKRRKRK